MPATAFKRTLNEQHVRGCDDGTDERKMCEQRLPTQHALHVFEGVPAIDHDIEHLRPREVAVVYRKNLSHYK